MTKPRPRMALWLAGFLLASAAPVLADPPGELEGSVPALSPPAADPEALDPASQPTGSWIFGRTPAVFAGAQSSVATRVGGWADVSFRDSNRRGSLFSVDHFNVFLDTRYRSWQAFVEAEYDHKTEHTGFEAEKSFEVEQGWIRFAPNPSLEVRLGRFNTPFGYWIPIHWAILMDTIEEPLHAGQEQLPEQQVGLDIAGRWFPGEILGTASEIDYSVYVGFGSNSLDQKGVDGFAGGGDLRLLLDGRRHLLGISAYRQRNAEFQERTETSFGLYGETKLRDDLTFRTEYVRQRRERKKASPWEGDIEFVYAKLRWDFLENEYINYRFSYGDDDDDETGRTAEQAIHTITLGVQPHRSVRIKLEYSSHDFRVSNRQDFNFWGLSVGVLF